MTDNGMPSPKPPQPEPPQPDQAARDRIKTDLDTTLFVEAGAGSGKTTALVKRVVALVTTGVAELRSIAAITFTDKAGAELRDRIRRQLELVATGADLAPTSPEAQARASLAIDQLDGAAIGTLHSFAQRLLSEHPVEAGLPPRVEVLDEVSSGVEFEQRWATFRDELLADPELERTILLLLATGVKPDALRFLAIAFDQNWDLVEERVPTDTPEPPRAHDGLEAALAAIDEVCRDRVSCTDPADKLRVRLDELAAFAASLRSIDDEYDLLDAVANSSPKPPSFRVRTIGKTAAWNLDIKDLQARVATAGDKLETLGDEVGQACAKRIGSAIRRFTLAAVEERRAAGQLEFHDLLVLARSLLRHREHGPAVRARLHDRYQRLLLDEFQDTDPIQIELAVRIAAADPRSDAAGNAPWFEVAVEPGHLFVVGDPKQSIYRFRRADISLFIQAAARFAPEGGGVVGLTANFRTGKPVIEWVNTTFARLMAEVPGVALPVPSQPAYVALDSTRPPPPIGAPVAVLGRAGHPNRIKADEIRRAEAAEVVSTVARAVADGWSVEDRSAPDGWRRAALGDITILVPARTSLPFLEDALEEAGIAFRAESSSLVYATRAVRDLLMVLSAIDDPTDNLRIVSALRTPLLACGDDDLFRFKVDRRGHWGYLGDQPDTVPSDDAVRSGLEYLRALHRERQWRTPSELLDRIVRDRRALELGFAEGRPRDVWRRLRFVIDQARAWSEATGGSLRQYLQWVQWQSAEGARVAESVLPETDDDAVRIMTIHAAKGLEFPITIVSGLSTAPNGRTAPAHVAFPPTGGVGYKLAKKVTTEEYEAWKPIDEQMGFDERVRLLYVACTRARDHLVVSLHRKLRAAPPDDPTNRTNAELLIDGMGAELLAALPDAVGLDAQRHAVADATRPEPPMPFDEWSTVRAAALRHSSLPTAVAATALTEEGAPDIDGEPDAGLQKRPRDMDLPPWLKGRYGTAVGRAVHGVLQTIDLATADGLDAAVAAQCEAEAVPDRATEVRRLVNDALGSRSVREAAASAHWREVYACTPVEGGRLLEGYVDLLYRGGDGLVVVDHKTSASSDPAELDRRVDGYRLQGASYALAVAAATDEPVVRVTFLFLTPEGAFERDLSDLEAAVAEARALVTAGTEVLVD